jgi:hypothetical protein
MRTLGFALFAAAAWLPTKSVAEEFDKTCAYALAEHGAEKQTDCSINWTDPETGKTYCFSREQTKLLFLQDPEENIRKAEETFAKLRNKKQ